ncbi:MAG: STAS domain-containing protein [Leptospira sp.]|nr:STAS domain-containing protein [Leptospira sp.]
MIYKKRHLSMLKIHKMRNLVSVKEFDLSYEGLDAFRDKINPLLHMTKEDIILDFSEIQISLDSSAIGELMKFHSVLEKKGLKLCLKNVNKLIRTVFKLNKLDTILTLID